MLYQDAITLHCKSTFITPSAQNILVLVLENLTALIEEPPTPYPQPTPEPEPEPEPEPGPVPKPEG